MEGTTNNSGRMNGVKAPLLLFVLLALMGFVVYKDYLLFRKIFFFIGVGSDTLNYSYPFLYNEANYIAQHGLPSWSFNVGLGQSIFPFFLRDPFDIILYVAGKTHIYQWMVFIEYLKVVLSGLVFFYYLKALKYADYTAIVGSMFFAFCGFMIIGGCWYVFSFEVFNMAVLLLGFELLFTRRKRWLFPIAVALMAISQPFNLYIYGTFMACYILFRHAQTGRKDIGATFVNVLVLSLAGLLISAPFLLENVAQLLESPRGSGTYSYFATLSKAKYKLVDEKQLGTVVMRLFSNNLLGRGDGYCGWFNYLEAPTLYCGIPCLLLMPQVFAMLDKRLKKIFAVFLVAWVIPVFYPYLRYAFWLFSGNYYRAYAFFIAFIFIYFSLYALDQVITKKRKINPTVLLLTVVALFGLLNYPFFQQEELKFHSPKSVGRDAYWFVSIMLPVYTALLLLMRTGAMKWATYIFAAAVIFEMAYTSHITVSHMDELPYSRLSEKSGYNDCTADAVSYIKANDKTFYRIDKAYFSSPSWFRSLNDAMAQGYYGTSSYASFNQQYTVLYYKLMGVISKKYEHTSRWATGLLNHPILESENRVKYIISKEPMNPAWRQWYDSAATICDVHIFKSKAVLPFGYTFDTYIDEGSFDSLSEEKKDIVSLRAAAIGDEDTLKMEGLKRFAIQDTSSISGIDSAQFRSFAASLVEDTLKLSSFAETSISGTINVSRNKVLYLSIPYDEGWQVYVDGRRQRQLALDAGMTGILLKPGGHTIELHYRHRFFTIGLFISVIGIILYAILLMPALKYRRRTGAIK